MHVHAAAQRILRHDEGDVVAFNRLGRAYEAIGSFDNARAALSCTLDIDPGNAIATRRLRQLLRAGRGDRSCVANALVTRMDAERRKGSSDFPAPRLRPPIVARVASL